MSYKSKFSRTVDDDDDENEASWQDSYSDLMTDLLAIFVILFSFAMMSQAIVIQAVKADAASQAEALAAAELEQSVAMSSSSLPNETDHFNNLYEYIKAYIEESDLSDQLSVTKLDDDKILLSVAASIFFNSGKAEINADAEPLLQKISEILTVYQDSIAMVRIEGHTDNRPINNYLYDSNWELSTSRAVNVLRKVLEISGLEAKKFSAIGYSEFYPVEDNSTQEGRARNRRVDFFIESED